MIRSVSVIVPHQDDELNIAGFLFDSFLHNNVNITILYVTKGNFNKEKYIHRIKERDKALKVFGNIKYRQLDYQDSYLEENHIFNDNEKRSFVENDIKSFILETYSDLIICIDCDSHADHRMVSVLFDSCMCNILKETNYRPIILKKFAYLGVWCGDFDYFSSVCQPTNPYIKNIYGRDQYDLCLPYSWEDRIRVKTSESDCGLLFWKSKVYKAYKAYFTQCGFRFFFYAANDDIVYWYRNTNSLLINADIKASSGCVEYINDFRISDIMKLTSNFQGINRFSDSAWIPDNTDEKKTFIANLHEPSIIRGFKIYQNFKSEGHINRFKIVFSNGKEIIKNCSSNDVDIYNNLKENNITWISFTIIDSFGKAGIREFELYSDGGEFPWNEVPFKKYETKKILKKRKTIFSKTVFSVLWIFYRAKNKIRNYFGLSHW